MMNMKKLLWNGMTFMRKYLINARKAAGLTVADLAARVGITRQHMYRIEAGEVVPSLDTSLRIILAIKEKSRDAGGYVLVQIHTYIIKEIQHLFSVDSSENGVK